VQDSRAAYSTRSRRWERRSLSARTRDLSANAGVKAVIDALNVVDGESEKRSFIRLNLLSLRHVGRDAALLLMVGARCGVSFGALITSALRATGPSSASPCRYCLRFCWRRSASSTFGPSGGRAVAMAERGHAGSQPALDRRFSLLSWYLRLSGITNATYGSLGPLSVDV